MALTGHRAAVLGAQSQEIQKMDVSRIQRILTSVMVITFLLFGLLIGVIFITHTPIDNITVSLPFAFLFISAMTLITTGQINDNPNRVNKYIRDWLILCIFGVLMSTFAFGLL
jgi:hypothetical protein